MLTLRGEHFCCVPLPGSDPQGIPCPGASGWPLCATCGPCFGWCGTSPPLVLTSTLLRLFRALSPLARLWISKLIPDGVVGWILHRSGSLAGVLKLVALELAVAVATGILARAGNLCDSLLADRFTNRIRVRLMEHATQLDLASFEDPVLYDKLERARRQTTVGIGLLAAMLDVCQDTLSLIALSAGLIGAKIFGFAISRRLFGRGDSRPRLWEQRSTLTGVPRLAEG